MPEPLSISDLRSHGYRMTPQRLTILRVLEEAGDHLTPVEIYQSALESLPGLTEATVYRTLNFLSQQGLALVTHIGNGHLVYEIAGRAHHHVVCRDCGRSIEIDHRLLEDLYRQLAAVSGFRIDDLHSTFFGVCPDCQKSHS